MTIFNYIPINLYPSQRLKFSRCTVVPGVQIKKNEGEISKLITAFYKTNPSVQKIHATHFVWVDCDVYFDNLKNRLKTEQKELPGRLNNNISEEYGPYIDAYSLAKQAMMALVLAGPVAFAMHGVFKVKKINNKYQMLGYTNTQHFEISPIVGVALLDNTAMIPVTRIKVGRFGLLLDPYYREGTWEIDRVAMALAHFWGALCTSFGDHALIGATTTLECLLLTASEEITLTLKKRVGYVLHKNSEKRIKTSLDVNKLYKIRSKLVHGKVLLKRGPVTRQTLCVSPKIMNVPTSDLLLAFKTALSVLSTILNNKNMMSAYRSTKNEKSINKELNEYFGLIDVNPDY